MNGAPCVPKGTDTQQTTEDVLQIEKSGAPGYRTCVKESLMTEFWRKLEVLAPAGCEDTRIAAISKY